MLQKLFRPRPDLRAGEALYAKAVEQARRPEFYTGLGVADRIDARFELYTLHVLLLVMRLKDEGEQGGEIAQRLFDTYVGALDDALRELGVGDLAIAKKMRRLGEALYGRMKTYEAPLREEDAAALAGALARNVYEAEDPAAASSLARYAMDSRRRLAAQPFSDVLNQPHWAEIAP